MSTLVAGTVIAFDSETGVARCLVPELYGDQQVDCEPIRQRSDEVYDETDTLAAGDAVMIFVGSNQRTSPKWFIASQARLDSSKVNRAGDIMTGPLAIMATAPGVPPLVLLTYDNQYGVAAHRMGAAVSAGVGMFAPNDDVDADVLYNATVGLQLRTFTDKPVLIAPNLTTSVHVLDDLVTITPRVLIGTGTGVAAGGALTITSESSGLRLKRTGAGINAPFLEFYSSTETRLGYMQGSETRVVIVSDVGDVTLSPASGSQVRVTQGVFTGNATSRFFSASTIFGTANAYLQFYGAATNVDSLGSRFGYVGFTGTTTMLMVNEAAGPVRVHAVTANPIDFYTSNAYQGRFTSGGDFVISKTATETTTAGVVLLQAGRIYTTTTAANNFNIVSNIITAANDDVHAHFRRSDASVGSINMNSTTGVDYASFSDMTGKGNSRLIKGEEATDIIMKMRPRRYQFLLDEDGNVSPEGKPSGPFQFGFFAQELYEVHPSGVMRGKGSWSQHKEWRTKRQNYDRAVQVRERWQQDKAAGKPVPMSAPPVPEDPGQDSPYHPWMSDPAKLVPVLTATVQDLVLRVKALEES